MRGSIRDLSLNMILASLLERSKIYVFGLMISFVLIKLVSFDIESPLCLNIKSELAFVTFLTMVVHFALAIPVG